MKEITMESRVKEVFRHPVGNDIIKKILMQMNISTIFINNPAVGNLKLAALAKLAKKQLGQDFFETLLRLLNGEQDIPASGDCSIKEAWWKEAVFYQIYPRSFCSSKAGVCDAAGDSLGDLKGIISRLDYLKELGVDALWLSPIYDSPNDDNGYDIRNYRRIGEDFGTMEDFDTLLAELHKRGMKLIMDLVVNHTSDEHEWFQSALKEENSPYKDYYFLRKGKKEIAPNNWTSFFSGSAWKYFDEKEEWALHLFSQKQMDLNWDNPALRADIIDMIRWWLEKGVDGFRMDVINYISKSKGLPQGNIQIGQMMGYYGIEHYFYGPKLHDYLKEIREKAFEPYHAFSVGETPGIGMEMGKLLTGDDRGELDMLFSFDHLETPGHVRFDDYIYDLNYLKKYYIDWMEHYGNHCWMSLFYDNHDNPRMISKVEKDKKLHLVLAKLLLTIQFTLKGTPFIYQGQELGEANVDFKSIEEMSDVESINLYKELCQTKSEEEAFRIVLSGSRDHARKLMDWEKALKEQKEEDSVYQYCQELAKLRRESKALLYGTIAFTNKMRENLFTYTREKDGEKWYVECNLCNKEIKGTGNFGNGSLVISNYKKECAETNNNRNPAALRPYEVRVYGKNSSLAAVKYKKRYLLSKMEG